MNGSLAPALQASLAALKADEGEIIAHLVSEWRSAICICGAEKWRNYPLCKRCSIRASRVGLYTFRYLRGVSLDGVERDQGSWTKKWAREYDRARDFAFVVHTQRGRITQHEQEEESNEEQAERS
jgi:hypothetical protein